MRPKRSILEECRWCMQTPVFHGCLSEICKLNRTELTYMKRIKEHCIDCVPEHSLVAVKNCTGYVDNPIPHQCILHPYRLGKNPKRQEAGKKQYKGTGIRNLKKTQFKPKEQKGT